MSDQFFLGSVFVNSDAGTLTQGDVVVFDSATNGGVKRTSIAGASNTAGIVVDGGPTATQVSIATIGGQRTRIKVALGDAIARLDKLVTSITPGVAKVDNTAGLGAVFAVAIEEKASGDGTEVDAILLPFGIGAPTGGPVTGSGVGTRVAFWTPVGATTDLGSDPSLYWDNTAKRLGIGTTTPTTDLEIKNVTAGPKITLRAAGDMIATLSVESDATASFAVFDPAGGSTDLLLNADNNIVGNTPAYQFSPNGPTVDASFASQITTLINFATYDSAIARTITNAATVGIAGPPVASGSVTITNSYSLWSQSGNVLIEEPADTAILTVRASGSSNSRVVVHSVADIAELILQGPAGNAAMFLDGNILQTTLNTGGSVPDIQVHSGGTSVATYHYATISNTPLAAGTVAERHQFLIDPTNYSGTGTITIAATLTVYGPPTVSGGGTITNPFASWVRDGSVRFDSVTGAAKVFAIDQKSGAGSWTVAFQDSAVTQAVIFWSTSEVTFQTVPENVDLVLGASGDATLTIEGPNNHSLVMVGTQLSPNAPTGYFYLRTMAGKPVSFPTSEGDSAVPLVVDTVNNRFCFYSSAAWHCIGGTAVENFDIINTDSTLLTADHDTIVRTTSGTITVFLPLVSSVPKGKMIRVRTRIGAGDVIMTRSGTDVISGSTGNSQTSETCSGASNVLQFISNGPATGRWDLIQRDGV